MSMVRFIFLLALLVGVSVYVGREWQRIADQNLVNWCQEQLMQFRPEDDPGIWDSVSYDGQ